jgi:hypothetical protein
VRSRLRIDLHGVATAVGSDVGKGVHGDPGARVAVSLAEGDGDAGQDGD